MVGQCPFREEFCGGYRKVELVGDFCWLALMLFVSFSALTLLVG